MYISACVIVKNEEKNIKRWYNSVKDCSDEQIVVDTGSTDGTIAILKTLPVKLYYYKWQNDFAAAKNFVIDKACGEWILFLDADEYFSENSIANLRSEIDRISYLHQEVNACLCLKINFDKENYEEISRFYDLCIFRNIEDLRYKGKIHEQLFNCDKLPQVIKNNNLVIYHTGYSGNLIKDKARRNLEILLTKSYAENEIIPVHYIAECYYVLGDLCKALEYIERYLYQKQYKVFNGESGIWRNYINIMILLHKPIEKILPLVFKAIKKFPDMADFYAFAGWLYWQKKNYIYAGRCFVKAIKKFETYNGIQETYFAADLPKVKKYLEQIDKYYYKKLKKRDRIFISACIIVKNNERDIKRWFNSVQQLSDEIIVVDTGSTDNTVNILNEKNVSVYYFQWCNDFAAAKNFALNKARGEWIVFLDADEYFSDNVNIRNKLLQLVDQSVNAVSCRMINIDMDNNKNEINRFMQIRIFRNYQGIYYQGKIHEQLRADKIRLNIIQRKDIVIYHTGYSQNIYLEKVRRNLKILQESIKKDGENKYYFRYLGDCYYALLDYKKAIRYYEKHLESKIYSLGNENDVYFNLIDSMIKEKYYYQDIFAVIKKAYRKFPNYPEFTAQCAALSFVNKHYGAAKRAFEKSLIIYKKERELSSDNFTAVLPEVYRYLSQIYLHENNRKQAFHFANKALLIDKYNYKALRIMCKCLQEIAIKDAVKCLGQYYGKNVKDRLFVCRQSFYSGAEKLFIYYNKVLFNEFGIYSENWRLWNIFMNEKNKDVTFDKLLMQVVEKVQLLVISLLLMRELPEKYHSILPESIWRCLSGYYNKMNIEESDFEAYAALLPIVVSHTNDEVLKKYITLGGKFALNKRCQIADKLCELEKWQYLNLLLPAIIKEQSGSNIEYIFKMGKCAYYNNKFNDAELFFRQALDANYNIDESSAYLTWINDRRSGKW
ncbi:glycosyltransferase family 2 protein [Pectinatus frisingensis]|uniref:glycosyltransferase family 2 protein n=1 Tax=Pectinatus frisingensis TaxID=865 RepID=UPI0015F4D03D|nr:glycosyltransferase family 2 protein [Pectinatus frisingensis]